MSHFVAIVIGKNVEKQLSKYDECIRKRAYRVGEVSDDDKNRMINYYKREKDFSGTFDQCYRKYGEDWNGGDYRKIKGVWYIYSTYNPLSKWDWYSVGGRWSGFFKMKEGVTPVVGESSAFDIKPRPGYGDIARKCDIDFDGMEKDEVIPFAVVKNGKWYEKGNMGWWGITTNEMDPNEWNKKVQELFDSIPDKTMLTAIDCHI